MSCRCALKATDEAIGRPTPRGGRAVNSLLPARWQATDGGRQNELPLRSEGNGRRDLLPRPAQRPRGDFFVAGKMPGNGRRAAR